MQTLALRLAMDAARSGQAAAIILNAANKVAVERFLDELIGFTQIEEVIAETLGRVPTRSIGSIGDVLELDGEARHAARGVAAG